MKTDVTFLCKEMLPGACPTHRKKKHAGLKVSNAYRKIQDVSKKIGAAWQTSLVKIQKTLTIPKENHFA